MTKSFYDAPELAAYITEYSKVFNEAIDVDQHHVSSPLGAWMLLAFLSEKQDSPTLKKLLGTDTTNAAEILEGLMKDLPEPIAATIHGWVNPNAESRYADLFARTRFAKDIEIKFPVEAELNKWAKDNTKGIIEKFPLIPDESFSGLFASALATDVKWHIPLEVDTAPQDSVWNVDTVLVDDNENHFNVVVNEELHTFIVHSNRSKDSLIVHSIIPVEDVSAEETMLLANEIATGSINIRGKQSADDVQVLEQALEKGTILKKVGEHVVSDPYTQFIINGWLPAWESENKFDLSSDKMAYGESLSVDNNEILDAVQVTKAQYGAEGFKAAAITAVMVSRAAVFFKEDRKVPVYEVGFNKPYAVVAVYDNFRSPWHKVPVFTGYIKQAVKA